MDMTAPVAAGINPPAPINGLGMLSSIIGIKQQQQNLQTGAYAQQAEQATSQQEQLKNQQLNALSQFMPNAMKDPKYRLPDGTLDTTKLTQDAQAVSGPYAYPAIGAAVSNANESIKTQQIMQNLSEDTNKTITSGLTGLANIPGGAKRSDVRAWVDQVEASNPNPTMRSALNNILLSAQADQNGNYSNYAARAAAALGGISMQAPGTQNLGGVLQPTSVTTMGPGIGQQTPVGPPVATVPGAQVGTNAASQLGYIPTGGRSFTPYPNFNPTPGENAPPGSAPGLGSNPTSAQVSSQTALAGIDNQRYAQVSQGGSTAQTGITLAQQVEDLASQVRTGKLSKDWTDRLAVLAQNQPGITARQMLSKYAAQLQTMALQNAPTDSARSQIESGMPNPETMDPGAVQQAAQYMGGLFGMNKARQQVADKYKQANGSTMGLSGADDAFMRSADPLLFAYQQLPAGKERQAFLASHGLSNRAALEDFAGRLNQVNHYVGP